MKTFALIILVPLSLVGVLLGALQYMEYSENPRSEFTSYEEMQKSGLIERGWIPEYLPRSSRDIKESHDIDTNRVWMVFKYDISDHGSVEKICQKLIENKRGKKYLCPPFNKSTSTLVLRSNGEGAYLSYENGI